MNATTFWFLAVGGTAALTHMVVFELVQSHMRPEWANALGFFIAFFVSFGGHRLLSFKDAATTLRASLGRFAVTALVGFISNELVFMLLLHGLDVPGRIALLMALVFAAGQTFVFSRFWAFRR